MILGASGAGKSSLLKAGIIPRLRREAPAWLPLRAFRPGADPLLNFAEALAHSLADFGKVEAHGVIRDRLFDAWSKAERVDGELTPAGRAALRNGARSRGAQAARRRGPRRRHDSRQRRSSRGDGAGGQRQRRGARRLSSCRLGDDGEQLAARLHDPHRQLPRAAKPSPFSGPRCARLRFARDTGVSLRQRGRGAGETLRRRGRRPRSSMR